MSHIKELSYDFARGLILGAGVTIGVGAVVVSSIAFASGPTGGKFGEALNKILVSGDWMNPNDGTVNNALTLSGVADSSKLMLLTNTTGCSAGEAINKIDAAGNIYCKPISTAP
ncbi:MAG: hypothetical protein U0518_04015 [Candidatus Gracilibacteria bacterium]